ncbi:MAG: hypothetical protein ABR84_08910 [Cryomorphaceae bacterium BACL21 MAG-121220-bin10]|nr:MAG: hypothetical protein ABR84_08910 [Cryomorphaceae bacterium BACL21 MAG-121220-bin10]
MRFSSFFLVFLCALSASAQTARKYSNEFLNIGVDAGAFGMANAVVASSGDVNSGYWNPAGLLDLEDQQMAIMHAAYFANIANYDYAGFAMPLDNTSAFGLSVIRFGVDNILNTTQLIDDQGNINYDNIKLFSTADYALTLSYAKRFPMLGLKLGGNAKIIRRVIGEFASSWGFGFDLGLQYQSNNNWHYGLMVRDITTTFNTWSIDQEAFATIQDAVFGQNQSLPETTEITLPKAQLGVAKQWNFRNDLSLRSELDLNVRFAQTNDLFSGESLSMTPALGAEVGYLDTVYVRLGAGNFQQVTQIEGGQTTGFQPNIGVGFVFKGVAIDYALTDIGDQSTALYSNVFSLKIDWAYFR